MGTREKQSAARKRFMASQAGIAFRKKLSELYAGRRLSEATKKKVSDSCKKNNVGKWMVGRKMPVSTLVKLRKIAESRRGVPRSEEVKQKIRETKRGKVHYNWQGGKTKLRTKLYFTEKYRIWRATVFRKDGFRCVLCKRKKKIAADHVIPFAFLLERAKRESSGEDDYEKCLNFSPLWDVKNGRTLCYECHYKTPNFGGKAIKIYARQQNGLD